MLAAGPLFSEVQAYTLKVVRSFNMVSGNSIQPSPCVDFFVAVIVLTPLWRHTTLPSNVSLNQNKLACFEIMFPLHKAVPSAGELNKVCPGRVKKVKVPATIRRSIVNVEHGVAFSQQVESRCVY
jgi:hypothetical protein